MPYARVQQVSMPILSARYPFHAEVQAGELWTPLWLKFLVWVDEGFKSKSTGWEADTLTTAPILDSIGQIMDETATRSRTEQ